MALAILRYRKGVSENFGGGQDPVDPIGQSSNPYASFGGESDQSYQQAPFSGTTVEGGSQPPPASDYQPPAY